jgi:hypothetical protein
MDLGRDNWIPRTIRARSNPVQSQFGQQCFKLKQKMKFRKYREYLSEEQRRQAGCPSRGGPSSAWTGHQSSKLSALALRHKKQYVGD